jgi:putative hydrolase of the HAD superfamily
MAIRFILFDAVGTLIYPQPSVAAAYERAAMALGIRLPQSEIRSRFLAAHARAFRGSAVMATDEARERQRWRDVVASVFQEWPQHVDELLVQLWQHFAATDHWPLFDDVAKTWGALSDRGYELGIASNFDARLPRILSGHACLASCQHVFFSTDLGYAKPDARFYREIERRLGAPPQDLLMVGDDEENDVSAPRSRGWQAIALDRNSGSTKGVRNLFELVNRLP